MSVGDNTANARVWFPGETTAIDSTKQETTVPGDSNTSEIALAASGVRTFFDTRVDSEATSRTTVNTRVSTLSARLVASGLLPVGV